MGVATLRLERIPVVDAYATTDSRAGLDAEIAELTALAEGYLDGRGGVNSPARELDAENPAVARLFDQRHRPALTRWRQQHVPTAAALVPLQRPDRGALADGTPFTPRDETWFRDSLDAIGIRSRAVVMREILREAITAERARTQRWLSLACGAAIPVFEAARELVEAGHRLQLTLADIDPAALRLAQALAQEYGLADCVELRRLNILDEQRLRASFAPDTFDAIDILGLFEYLPDENRVTERRVTLGATGLIRAALQLLKPGGRLILGNMLDTHPQLRFTLDVIQWPYIRPRSVGHVAELLSAAGGDVAGARACAADDGVYAVYVLERVVA